MIKRILTLSMLPLCILVAQELLPLVDFDSLERIGTDTRYSEPQAISLVTEGQTEGKGCVRVDINNGPSTQKNHYGMLRINLEKPIDLRGKALLVDIKALTPEYAQGLYVRCYNRGAEKPSISYQNWDSILKEQWTTLRIQDDFTLPKMKWEPKEVDGKPVDNIQVIRLYFASISQHANTRQSYLVDNLRLVPAIEPPSNVMPNKTRTPVALDLPPAPASGVIHPLDTLDDITFPPLSDKVPPSKVQVVDIDGGKAISLLGGLNPSHEGNQYHHIVVNLRQPLNLEKAAVAFDARTDHPIETTGFYVRFYNRKNFKPSWSFSTWGSLIRPEWRTFTFQRDMADPLLSFEKNVVDGKPLSQCSRIEFIIGGRVPAEALSAIFRNLRLTKPAVSAIHATSYLKRHGETELVENGKPSSIIIHPDTEAGRAAAAKVVAAIRERTGVGVPTATDYITRFTDTLTPETRPGNPIFLGNMANNRDLALLYARRFSYADWYFPGAGKYHFLHVAQNPFGNGHNAILAEASDDVGLASAAQALAARISQLPKGATLVLPSLHELKPGPTIAYRYRYQISPEKNLVEAGLKNGRKILKDGKHCSIAGQLESLGLAYMLGNSPQVAKLYVELWKMYYQHVQTTTDVTFDKWGFDSDFPSENVVASWDLIEDEPSLTDEERLFVSKVLLTWMNDIVIPSCDGGQPGRVTHNHGTFPSLGALRCAIWLNANFPGCVDAKNYLAKVDRIFREQSRHSKPKEDCNGYQWLTLGHTLRYAMVRPDPAIFESGVAGKIVDYCLQCMDNFTIQVPYGDTGSWKCWESENVCLDIVAHATGNENARWAVDAKRKFKGGNPPVGNFSQKPLPGNPPPPTQYDGLLCWPVIQAFYDSHKSAPETWCPPIENCVDKITFREKLDIDALYLLLDGISVGGHKHEDGNSIPRITQYGRIWLADNDYFKAPLKYHNSLAIIANGESGTVRPFVELVAAGEDEDYAYTITAFRQYVRSDWRRALVWLKKQRSILVLDAVTALEDAEYQMKLSWHGIGEPALDGDGLLLAQDGPSMRIQVAGGPTLSLDDDIELGKNWGGYPYAKPIVRSMAALENVKLAKGETYTFATIFHGRKEGTEPPWKMAILDGQNGVLFDDGNGPVAIALDSLKLNGLFAKGKTGALNIADGKSTRSLEARPGVPAFEARPASPAGNYVPAWAKASKPFALKCRAPKSEGQGAKELPAHLKAWEFIVSTNAQYLTPNKAGKANAHTNCTMLSDPVDCGPNVLTNGSNTPENLLDGSIRLPSENAMYPVDTTVRLTFTFKEPVMLEDAVWANWHARTSSKNTSYLLEKAILETSQDGSFGDAVVAGEYLETRKMPDWGSPVTCRLAIPPTTCRAARLTLIPQKGSSIYLAEVALEGNSSIQQAPIPQEITAISTARRADGALLTVVGTEFGDIFLLDEAGKMLRKRDFTARVNALACADLDKDGSDEIIIALENATVVVVKNDFTTLWDYLFERYRVYPSANVVYTGELNGDGYPEVVVGCNNWRFYAFDHTGKFLWHFESVHPSRSGAVSDLDGDGLDEVLCGTHYYTMYVLNGLGKKVWSRNFGPLCWSIATGRFAGDKSRGVIAGSGNGYAYLFDSKGGALASLNTGEEVHNVLAADLDAGTPEADGREEALAASYSQFIYAWNGDGAMRWYQDLGAPILSCISTTAKETRLHAGLKNGRLLTLNGKGETLLSTDLGQPVILLHPLPSNKGFLAATQQGRLCLLTLEDK